MAAPTTARDETPAYHRSHLRWPGLRDELLARKADARHVGPDDPVFATRSGARMSRDNTRTRVLLPAHAAADEALIARGLTPLPEKLTQHSLRHIYISLRVALGDDPATIAQDAGHADMTVTFRIYTHVMRLQPGDRERLRALVEGTQWAALGTNAPDAAASTPNGQVRENEESPAKAGLSAR